MGGHKLIIMGRYVKGTIPTDDTTAVIEELQRQNIPDTTVKTYPNGAIEVTLPDAEDSKVNTFLTTGGFTRTGAVVTPSP